MPASVERLHRAFNFPKLVEPLTWRRSMPATLDLNQWDPLSETGGNAAPVIDLDRLEPDHPDRESAVAEIRNALTAPGYFCVSGIVSRSPTWRNALEQMQTFFERPDDDPVKQAINVSGEDNTNGWMPCFGEPAYQPGTVAHLESFDCSLPQTPDDDPRANRWPPMDGFREDITRLWDELGETGHRVMRAIAEALGLDPGYFVERCRKETLSTMRLLHYPPVTEAERTAESVGIAAHTDFECLTLIAQTAEGLELLDTGGHWRDGPADADHIVVLLGDMLERWTNGQVCATGHRVRPRSFDRFSIVKFFAVDADVTVEPLPDFITPDRPSAYAPIRQGEHTRAELARATGMQRQVPEAAPAS
jgi:isopenicillin N synthase-like dioxygenase